VALNSLLHRSVEMNASAAAAVRRAVPNWPGWQRLPREARDTLFLLAVIAWTVLPHASHLPPWAIAMTAIDALTSDRVDIARLCRLRPYLSTTWR